MGRASGVQWILSWAASNEPSPLAQFALLQSGTGAHQRSPPPRDSIRRTTPMPYATSAPGQLGGCGSEIQDTVRPARSRAL
ncbi:MAG: hypothetical protein ABSG43_17650 [Solirubrobacteraceae bacterium]